MPSWFSNESSARASLGSYSSRNLQKCEIQCVTRYARTRELLLRIQVRVDFFSYSHVRVLDRFGFNMMAHTLQTPKTLDSVQRRCVCVLRASSLPCLCGRCVLLGGCGCACCLPGAAAWCWLCPCCVGVLMLLFDRDETERR